MPRFGRLGLILLVLLLACLASLALGSVPLGLGEILSALAEGVRSRAGMSDPGVPASVASDIFWHLRLPRTLTSVFAGAALAVSGLLMQTLFRNPLAGPFVLGISSGASLGVALVTLGTCGALGARWVLFDRVAWLRDLADVGAAGLGAGLVMGLMLVAARRLSTPVLLLLGVLLGYAAGALVMVLLHFSPAEEAKAYLAWTFGSFGGVAWPQLRLLLPLLGLCLGLSLFVAKPLDGLLLGQRYALSVGVDVRRLQGLLLLITAILAGGVTAFCGPIGFLGVAVPHLARSLLGAADHRILLPGTAMLGSLAAVTADLVARLPGGSSALPLNAVTALLGAPVIAWVIVRRANRRGLA